MCGRSGHEWRGEVEDEGRRRRQAARPRLLALLLAGLVARRALCLEVRSVRRLAQCLHIDGMWRLFLLAREKQRRLG